jgi:hypothetical protein
MRSPNRLRAAALVSALLMGSLAPGPAGAVRGPGDGGIPDRNHETGGLHETAHDGSTIGGVGSRGPATIGHITGFRQVFAAGSPAPRDWEGRCDCN